MAGIVLGLIASIYFFKNGGEYIRENYLPDIKVIPEILAFILLFMIVFLAVKVIAIMLKGIFRNLKLGGVDKFLGLVFGFAEGIVVISLALLIINIQPLFDPEPLLSKSFFAQLLLPLITGARLPPVEIKMPSGENEVSRV
jgi:membrane protein required for colicin V production